MARLFLGRKTTGGGGCVKVMRNNGDDPNTTPNTDVGKFLFNSETQKLGYMARIRVLSYDIDNYPPPASPGINHYYPDGGNADTAPTIVYSARGLFGVSSSINQYWGALTERLQGDGIFRIVERFRLLGFGEWRDGPRANYSIDAFTNNRSTSRVRWEPMYVGNGRNQNFYGSVGVRYSADLASYSNSTNPLGTTTIAAIWDLPALNQALPAPVATPLAGQKNVLLNPTTVKVARPGFDVGSASGAQLILDSNRIPAKVVAAGQITLAGGAQQFVAVPAGISLTVATYVDYMAWPTGQSVAHPFFWSSGSPPEQSATQISHALSAGGVTFRNNVSSSITVRYAIFADDDSAPSTGGSQVMRRGSAGGQDFIQIKRPGSSDSAPRLNDIMLDTRFSYFPILAEGYLAEADFNEAPTSVRWGSKGRTITFANGGTLPFLKFVVQLSDGSWRTPVTGILFNVNITGNPFTGHQYQQGTPALVTDTSVKFHLAREHPASQGINPNNFSIINNYDSVYPVGVRYFVFGIPTSL